MEVSFFIGMLCLIIAIGCCAGALYFARKTFNTKDLTEFRVLFTFAFALGGGIMLIALKNHIVEYYNINPNSWGLIITAIAAYLIYISIVYLIAILLNNYRENRYSDEE